MPWFVQGEDGRGNATTAREEAPRDNQRSAKAHARHCADHRHGPGAVAVFEAEAGGGRVLRELGAWHVEGSGAAGDPVRVVWHQRQPSGGRATR